MQPPAIMVLGTHSNAGKSLIAAAFCRILARRGLHVAPFKAQNISNNAGVTADGGEMGRAQIVQCEAAGILPHTDMNPVLLKPEAERRSQIVLNGTVFGHMDAANWLDIKAVLWREVRSAYDRLADRYDVIVMEGAGSPAEINLKQGDIVNLRMARHAGARCLLVGDIDRGGVFAALAGTMLLLEPDERCQIHGFLINKFRGDPALLGNATALLQERAFGVPTLGVIPFIPGLRIAAEDAVALEEVRQPAAPARAMIEIAVVHLPHIANFDEFDALATEPNVCLRYVRDVSDLDRADAIIVPGTKVTLSDLAWLRARGLDGAMQHAHAQGASVVGICGGFQMLGYSLSDPLGVEGAVGDEADGLALLAVTTRFTPQKETFQATLRTHQDLIVNGYEIHAGKTILLDGAIPFGTMIRRGDHTVSVPDGAVSPSGRVWGTYLHGIFEDERFRRQWLATLGWAGEPGKARSLDLEYDRLADVVEEQIGWPTIEALIWGKAGRAY